MKRLMLLVLLLALPVHAQTIPWDGDNPCCRNYLHDGSLYTTYTDEDVSVTVVLILNIDDEYVFALMSIDNHSDQAFTIYPEKVSTTMTGDQPFYASYADDVAREIEKRGKLGRGLRTFVAGLARKNVATIDTTTSGSVRVGDNQGNTATGTYESRSRATVSVPDQEARQRAAVKNANEKARNESLGAMIRSRALRANTIFSGNSVHGTLYFKPKKLKLGMILTIPLGERLFEIPYGIERKK